MTIAFSDIFAGVALLISSFTFYFVYLWRGKIKMTVPPQVWFGYTDDEDKRPFIFVKTLLYATSLQGTVIETMYARVSRNETKQSFSYWCIGFGTSQSQLGGLKIHNGGVLTDNVFVSPNDGSQFSFASGKYLIEIFARTVGKQKSILLKHVNLEVPQGYEENLLGKNVLQFHLQSNGKSYNPSLGNIPRDMNDEFLKGFNKMIMTMESIDADKKADVYRRHLGLK